MEKVSVSGLKNSLSAYLRKVRAGQSVVIYDRDVPIARIERIESGGRGLDRLAKLRAQGLTRPPVRLLKARKLSKMIAALKPGARLADALRSDREEGR